MERGLPGLPGLLAAPAVVLVSRSVSVPAATQRHGTADGCVWARIVRRGSATSPFIIYTFIHVY